ncbi:MAG: ATP-binding protein [Bacteroidetes bacterium]|nr:ATP-binding protein [Bacteroidota bacterium]
MKQIVVMSGKGGTGKTTITAALGQLAGKRAVMADCDVDAANLHLLLRPAKSVKERFVGGMLPMIDTRGCTECGYCETACAFSAIVLRNGQYEIDSLACEGCGVCSHVCPGNYITMMPRVTGHFLISRSRFDQIMVHAALGIGQENSGKLVTKVKTEALSEANRENIPCLLVDGPPGIGCPAIAAVSGATEVLLVTEATRAGLHDLRRLMKLLAHFSLPASCVINKADLDEHVRTEIHAVCEEQGIAVIAEIPWTDVFPESLRQGKTLIEMSDARVSDELTRIWTHINSKGECV